MFGRTRLGLIPLAVIVLSFSTGSLMAGPPHIETPGYQGTDVSSEPTPISSDSDKPKPKPKPEKKPKPKPQKKPKPTETDHGGEKKSWWEW